MIYMVLTPSLPLFSRLNCTTFSVTKFSKQTQNMMAKHKIDSLVHTREVVSEIQHLTKMLNFHDVSTSDDSSSIWCNINWGENAPYWNQYYKIIRNYNYPFEVIFFTFEAFQPSVSQRYTVSLRILVKKVIIFFIQKKRLMIIQLHVREQFRTLQCQSRQRHSISRTHDGLN